ncbi:MAG: nuclear transport factor 2 family protein [Geodermatophilaceae bacterium]|nr:nuclear transport factor 2 family protein [Geodermatophilaceae bacterium]
MAASTAQRIQEAIAAHDLDALVRQFSPNYRNETPIHPARSFTGAEQVRANWAEIFRAVPDLRADLVRHAVDGTTEWAEWAWQGTRVDGQPLQMAGVTILGLSGGRVDWARFYVEPVDHGSQEVAAALAQTVGPRSGAAVRSAPPPRWLVRGVLNRILRPVLRSPLGRVLPGPLVLLRCTGRRTGRRIDVPVLAYDVDGVLTVFSPAAWTANLHGGAPVSLRQRGRSRSGCGVLVTDPAVVGTALRTVLARGVSPRALGLRVDGSRPPTDAEASGVRSVVQLQNLSAPSRHG